MSEEAVAGEQHGHAARIGLVNDLLVANGPARLYDGGRPSIRCLLETVFEREKGIRSHHAVFGALPRSSCGDFHGFGATGLTRPDAHRRRALNHDNGV